MARASAKGGRRPRPDARKQPAEPVDEPGEAQPAEGQATKPQTTGVKPVKRGSRVVSRTDATEPAAPREPKGRTSENWEDQLFFARLRRHMKWVFALLGCGIAPVAAFRRAGLRVGLGTDSPASAPSFDMFEELRAAVMLSRAREMDAAALTAHDALELATIGSARALGLGDGIGSLEPGKWADLTIVDLSASGFAPIEDPAVALVLGGTPGAVCRTIVGGATRYARGGFEWHELRQRAAAARARMLEPNPPSPTQS
jgi:hypothetical protein